MLLEHRGHRPRVHDSAYVAPNAVLSGEVSVGAGTSILFGAVVTADGGPVQIGDDCVVMENAVLRGTPKHRCRLKDGVLVGPHAHLTGCEIDEDVFLATGSSVFNGARVERRAEIRINGVVHVNTVVSSETIVPIGWIAVGDPARVFAPADHEQIWEIQRELDFPKTVWGLERDVPRGERTRRYARALLRHREDTSAEDE